MCKNFNLCNKHKFRFWTDRNHYFSALRKTSKNDTFYILCSFQYFSVPEGYMKKILDVDFCPNTVYPTLTRQRFCNDYLYAIVRFRLQCQTSFGTLPIFHCCEAHPHILALHQKTFIQVLLTTNRTEFI